MAKNTHFWNQLLMRSDSIVDIDPQADDAREQILGQLTTISEQFDRTFDPADQFEEYVAVAFCQAVQRALTSKSTATCKMLSPNPMATPNPKPATVLRNPPKSVATSATSDVAKPSKGTQKQRRKKPKVSPNDSNNG